MCVPTEIFISLNSFAFDNLTEDLYIRQVTSLLVFSRVSLWLCVSLIMTCPGVSLFEFILLGVGWVSWVLTFISFIKFGKFIHCVFVYSLCRLLSPFLWDSISVSVGLFSGIPQVPEAPFTFSTSFLALLISSILSSRSLILCSAFSDLPLNPFIEF